MCIPRESIQPANQPLATIRDVNIRVSDLKEGLHYDIPNILATREQKYYCWEGRLQINKIAVCWLEQQATQNQGHIKAHVRIVFVTSSQDLERETIPGVINNRTTYTRGNIVPKYAAR
jgi:hypothetical protein